MLDIALVSYINTRPFMDGFEAHISPEEAQFHLLPPSSCTQYLLERKCQMALLPVGALPLFKKVAIMPNYCIGANGPVESVFLFSQRPIEEIDTVFLDRHSNSSNGLTRVLMKHHWKKEVRWIMPEDKHFDKIKDNIGGVVIGDKALRIRDEFTYQYDLADEWKKMTGLPFAFAVWAYIPGAISQDQLKRFNEAMRFGVSQAEKTAEKWGPSYKIDRELARHYLLNCIDYHFDQGKHKALDLYFKLLTQLPELKLEVLEKV